MARIGSRTTTQVCGPVSTLSSLRCTGTHPQSRPSEEYDPLYQYRHLRTSIDTMKVQRLRTCRFAANTHPSLSFRYHPSLSTTIPNVIQDGIIALRRQSRCISAPGCSPIAALGESRLRPRPTSRRWGVRLRFHRVLSILFTDDGNRDPLTLHPPLLRGLAIPHGPTV